MSFDSYALAIQAAKRYRRGGAKRAAYRCEGCRQWHLCGIQGFDKAPHPHHSRGRVSEHSE